MGLFHLLLLWGGGRHTAQEQLFHPALSLRAGSPTCCEPGVIREMNGTSGIFTGWTHRVSWRPAVTQYWVVTVDRHDARLGGGGWWWTGERKAGQSQRRQNFAQETSVSLCCPWKMNSGNCWWIVWPGACLRGRIRESGGAGTGAMSNTTHRNKEHMCTQSLCAQCTGEGGHTEGSVSFIHMLLSPFVQSKQRPISLQTSPSPPLLVPPALDQPVSSREAYCLTMTELPWCLSWGAGDLLLKRLPGEETPARSHSCGASCSSNALFRITALQSITLPQWLHWNLVLIHINKDQI